MAVHAEQTPQGSATMPVSQFERFREQARDGGLADAARAREQIRVMQAIVGEGIGERLHDVRLPDELLEPPRPPLARQNRVTHASSLFP